MDILLYNELDYSKVKKQFEKTLAMLKAGDFKSADAKKMQNTGFYRAKLDDTNRLLFKYVRHQNKAYLVLLEVILNHDYDKSRFLNGAEVDESKFTPVYSEAELQKETSPTELTYINPKKREFHILDKILSFDDIQEDIFALAPPLIIIGSAGSGKTALTLEKIKTLHGNVLYTTLSAFLAENARNLYYSFEYENNKQEVTFMSFNELLASVEAPKGKEVSFKLFDQWIWRYKHAYKIKDAYKVFEEFKGVITGYDIHKPYLSKEEYLNLGIKQSIFPETERPLLYELFQKYLAFLEEGNHFDSNILAYQYLAKTEKKYDFVVIDEVQDITNVQLFFILKQLHNPTSFILCGDSNQIVHPNFFSWSHVKTLFYQQELKGNIIRILATNYRNTPEVTKIANQLLLVKNARFGSIDKESTYLVQANSKQKGDIQFLENLPKVRQDMNQRTGKSARFAVVVMRDEDKHEARKYFQTPLLFSVHEVKGLEYENVILYNIISDYEKEFREICGSLNPDDITPDKLQYSRAKDKSDKSLDEFKFYINSLYVAITRAVSNLYVIETNKKHALLALLQLTNFGSMVNLKEQRSTQEEWQREARRLEMQGKQEQADAIKKQVLNLQPVPWQIITPDKLETLKAEALNPDLFNKKAKDALFEYALFYQLNHYFIKLSNLKYRAADNWQKEYNAVLSRKFSEYKQDNVKQLQQKTQKYGFNFCYEFNVTPFMVAIMFGAAQITQYLIENGANTQHADNMGRNALRLALLRCFTNAQNKTKFAKIYPFVNADSFNLLVHNRLVKLNKQQAEYLMLQIMIAVYATRLQHYLTNPGIHAFPIFDTAFFIDFFDGFSQQVIPDYRRQRAYISSILSKNEVHKNDPYNKRLFLRVATGKYVPNPLLAVAVNEEWVLCAGLTGLNSIDESNVHFTHTQLLSFIHSYMQNPLATPLEQP